MKSRTTESVKLQSIAGWQNQLDMNSVHLQQRENQFTDYPFSPEKICKMQMTHFQVIIPHHQCYHHRKESV